MCMDTRIMIAGFGGQGILFAGKFLVWAGMLDGHEVSWLPSYGPEMRGGTANCSVIISDEPVGSPLVTEPNVLAVMNLPSLDRFEQSAARGAQVFVDSAMVPRTAARADIACHAIPATQIARDNGIPRLANMVLVGKILRETGLGTLQRAAQAMEKVVPARHAALMSQNLAALRLGYTYAPQG